MVGVPKTPASGAQTRAPRVTPRDTPVANPAVDPSAGSAGLTPQQAIVNIDHTPTMFFFRWLLNTRSQGGAQGGTEGDSGISVNGVLAGSVVNGPITVNGIAA